MSTPTHHSLAAEYHTSLARNHEKLSTLLARHTEDEQEIANLRAAIGKTQELIDNWYRQPTEETPQR